MLERLRDEDLDRFDALNEEIARGLPEYDRVLLNTPAPGQKGLALRTRTGKHAIAAAHLSQGTLLSLAMLTLAHLPMPPFSWAWRNPTTVSTRGCCANCATPCTPLAIRRAAVKRARRCRSFVTTHSPYLLDLFRDHPEEIVLAHKVGLDVQFERLADKPDFEEVLGDAPLSEVWYTRVLGGVP